MKEVLRACARRFSTVSSQVVRHGISASPAVSRSARDLILLKGITLHGHHGYYEPERVLGQKFVLDLELGTCLEASGKTDCLKDTIGYDCVYEDIRRLFAAERYKLLETVAFNVTKLLFERYESLYSVKIRVKKPQVPMSGVLEYTAVELYRTREDFPLEAAM